MPMMELMSGAVSGFGCASDGDREVSAIGDIVIVTDGFKLINVEVTSMMVLSLEQKEHGVVIISLT
jgi:hypothetical protein